MKKFTTLVNKTLRTSHKLKIYSVLVLCFFYNHIYSQSKDLDSYKQVPQLKHKLWDEINTTDVQKVFNLKQESIDYSLEYNNLLLATNNNYFSQNKPVEIKAKEDIWYKTTYAYYIYIILVIGAILLFFLKRIATIKNQLKIAQSKVVLKTNEFAELNQSLDKKVQETSKINNDLTKKNTRYKYALELLNEGIWDYNIINDTMKFSSSIYKLLGYEPYEFDENRDEFYNKIADEDDRLEYIEKHNKLINEDENPQLGAEYKMKKKNGDIIWIQSKAKVVERDNNGHPSRLIGTLKDITLDKWKTQQMLGAILRTENIERSRISREIHDGLQQTLIISALNFQSAKKELSKLSPKNIEKFEIGWKYLQDSIIESRTVAHSLMPKAIIDFGLISAVESLINEVDKSTENTVFNFLHNFKQNKIKNQLIEITLYRVLQEAINNIIKYAKATNVTVQLKDYDEIFMLTIEDDGVGFDAKSENIKKHSLGFQSMRNRLEAINGFLEIDSRINHGTTLVIIINKRDGEN